jgi:hypothetical protein
MERSLLGLHPLYQFLDPVECLLIRDAGRHVLVMLDLAVEFDALLTHCNFRIPYSRVLAVNIGCCLDDGETAGLFYKFKLGHLGSKQ